MVRIDEDRIKGALGSTLWAPLHFQVVPLNITNCIFAFNVIRKGQLIYESDHEAVTDFIEIISRRYGENYPRYIKYLKEIVGA